MGTFPVVVSYYTVGTPYEGEVKKLVASCHQFGLEHKVEGVESFGSWELNCAYKPFFIYKMVSELQRPVLWVDADGVFLRQPSFIEAFQSDLAVRINAGCSDNHPSKVITSTIFVNTSGEAALLLKAWMQESSRQILDQNRKEEFWDQIALRDALKLPTHRAKVKALPNSYARIFDHPEDLIYFQHPVIEHYQASRRFKNLVND